MQILVLLGMYFDAVVVFVNSQTLLFRLALAILWVIFYLRFIYFVAFSEYMNFMYFDAEFIFVTNS